MPNTGAASAPDTQATDLADAPSKLVLIDGNSLLYRGFFAMRALTTSAGQPTNAVFSFTMMLLTLLADQKPDVIIAAWDTPQPTFRHKEFKAYKGTRSAPPTELTDQGPIAREMLRAFAVPMVEAPGYEADDVIGTLTTRARALGYNVLIVTGDLDALQLVEPGVRVMTTVKGVTDVVIYDDEAVRKRYSLTPAQLTDYRALKGDTSDNIPGVPGVGEKTASQLLQKYGTIEELLYKLDEVTPSKLQAALVGATDQMRQAKRLATILRDVPLEGMDIPALDAASHEPDWTAVRALFEKLEFRTLLRRLPGANGTGPSSITAADASDEGITAIDLEAEEYNPFADTGETVAPQTTVASAPVVPQTKADFRDASTPETIADLVRAVQNAHRVAVRLHTVGDGLDAKLQGVAVAVGDGIVYYVPAEVADDAREPRVPGVLAALLEDAGIHKAAHDSKSDIAVLRRAGSGLQGVMFDTELAAYLLSAGRRSGFPLVEVAADYAGRELPLLDKKERKGKDEAELHARDKNAALLEADAVLATMAVQEPRLAADGLTRVMETLELPVAPILADMELAGLTVDVPVLNRMAGQLQTRITALETQIYDMAGGEFSITSIKQLQEVLFEKLKIPANKKTKTGYSTSAEVLEELAPDYPIVKLVLEHRELTKLKNTYAEAMPVLVQADGRIHTTLNQTVAATGRLSSSNPNLQNIPIRTPIGREIRRAFVAPPGKVLVSADYSQIELRIFAHVSRDPELTEAFTSGEDIHKYTAGKIYDVPASEVTGDMRRAAKTVNYAVIYGISEFALARRLGISMLAAKELKTSYFNRFPGVKRYMDETIAFAKEKGYVQTLFGRRRYIPDINSRVFQFRQAAERAAANMPIQGSSADIMKVAMVSVSEMLRREKMDARMLLQVHDELLFEAAPNEVNTLAGRVHQCMSEAYPLDVALDVEVKTGTTWADVTPVEDMAAPGDASAPEP